MNGFKGRVLAGLWGLAAAGVLAGCGGGSGEGGAGAAIAPDGVAAASGPQVSPLQAKTSVVGTGVTVRLVAQDPAGRPMTFDVSGLPPGVSLDAVTGTLDGTPAAAGSYTVRVVARTDDGRDGAATFAWTVLGVVPKVASVAAPVTERGTPIDYAPVLTSGAPATYRWNFGDGDPDTAFSADPAVRHSFARAGVHTVTLTVRTDDGRLATHAFLQAVVEPGSAGSGVPARRSGSLLVEPRAGGAHRVWNVNIDNDSVSVFDAALRGRVAEITVGAAPRTLARAADGRVWVVNRDAATISIIDPSTLAVVQTVTLPRASQPFGIVFSPVDGSAFVALQGSGQVLKLDGSTGGQIGAQAVGEHPRHLALTPSGDRLLVSRFITPALPGEGTAQVATVDGLGAAVGGEVRELSPASLAVLRTITLAHGDGTGPDDPARGLPNYLGAVAIAPDARVAYVPSKQDNVLRGALRDGRQLDWRSTVRAVVSRLDLVAAAEDRTGRIDHDRAGVASAAVWHDSGAYLFVALETSRQVAVVDPVGRRELMRFEVGYAPQALALAPDGRSLYVNNMADRTISLIDLTPLLSSGQLAPPPMVRPRAIGTERLPVDVQWGKRIFYDARDPRMSREGHLSCAACHNDGGFDGRTWDFTGLGEGLRNTISLRGRAGTGHGFLHWSANFDEVQDFETQIRRLQGGTGLLRDTDYFAGTRSEPLGDRKAGLSFELDALAAFVTSLSTFAPSPHRLSDGTLTPAAQAGAAVFQSAGCVNCHAGPGFTASADAASAKDIGTIRGSSGQRLGSGLTAIDVPTLRDAWLTAPYLHDGSAATLADAVRAHRGLTLSVGDLANLVEYLRQLGGE